MFTKAWIAILIGLLLGSLFLSSGCGWFGDSYSNNPYGYAPCGCPPATTIAPAGAVPGAGGTPGWRAVQSSGGAAATAP
jgi:hypothetical protein